MAEKTFTIDGKSYDLDTLNAQGRKLLASLEKLQQSIDEKKNMVIILNKAKLAYSSDIKSEVIATKAGFDFLGD